MNDSPEPRAPEETHPVRQMIGAVALVVLTLVVYIPAIGGDFVWDDKHYFDDSGVHLQPRVIRADAIHHYRAALGIRPDLPETHYNPGGILHPQGRTAEAIRHYRVALKINPGHLRAQNSLERSRMGRCPCGIANRRRGQTCRYDVAECSRRGCKIRVGDR